MHREDTTRSPRPAYVDGRAGQSGPPANPLSPTLNRRHTVSSPATTALPMCGICRPLHYNSCAAAHLSDADAESSVEGNGEEPQSLAVEIDSDQLVDVAVGTERLLETASSRSSDWLSSRHHEARQIISEHEPQWTEIDKLPFCLTHQPIE